MDTNELIEKIETMSKVMKLIKDGPFDEDDNNESMDDHDYDEIMILQDAAYATLWIERKSLYKILCYALTETDDFIGNPDAQWDILLKDIKNIYSDETIKKFKEYNLTTVGELFDLYFKDEENPEPNFYFTERIMDGLDLAIKKHLVIKQIDNLKGKN